MKKNKKKILIALIVVFGIASGVFYFQSKNVTMTGQVHYNETGGVSYKVYLKDKKYYNKDFLGEGMQYIASIIDRIGVDFNYNANYDSDNQFNIVKKVLADVKIVDSQNADKVIYTKQEIYKNDTTKAKDIKINDTISIDYKKYNDLANDFKTSYGISANCKLVVSYIIDYSSEDGELKQNRVLNIEVPLSEQMINITKSSAINNNLVFFGKTTHGSINKIFFYVSLSGLFITAALIILLIVEIIKGKKSESKYDNYIKKLLRQYDAYITEAKDDKYTTTKSTISIQSFKELMDVRNSVEKAIIYVKENENSSKFMIVDEEVYVYKVTRDEMDK